MSLTYMFLKCVRKLKSLREPTQTVENNNTALPLQTSTATAKVSTALSEREGERVRDREVGRDRERKRGEGREFVKVQCSGPASGSKTLKRDNWRKKNEGLPNHRTVKILPALDGLSSDVKWGVSVATHCRKHLSAAR